MSTETPTAPPPPAPKAAKPKRKPQRKPQRRQQLSPAAKETASPLAGITAQDCPGGCVPKQCAISGGSRCAHPFKGGLPAGMQTDLSLRRLHEAKRILGKQKLDLTAA